LRHGVVCDNVGLLKLTIKALHSRKVSVQKGVKTETAAVLQDVHMMQKKYNYYDVRQCKR